jgi:hypothetical protein
MKTKNYEESFEDMIPKPQTLLFKLWKAKQEIKKVTKGNDNPYFKSKYADLNTILDACEPILLKYDLLLLQPLKNGYVCTQIIDIQNGDLVESQIQLPNIVDPQKMIAACTYYRRASLQSLLSLQAVDDDGNTASDGAKRVLSEERFNESIKACINGDYDPLKLKSQYDLTEVQLKRLNEVL